MVTLTQITAEDFERIAPVLGPSELVRGEIVPTSPGGVEHSSVTVRIVVLLELHNRKVRRGRVLSNEAGIVVRQRPDTVRGADVVFISYKRLPASEDWKGFLRHRPELVVEVLSRDDSWEKMEAKIADYHAFGVDMIWVADPQTVSVRRYPRGGEPSVLNPKDVISGGSFLPGFRCKVAKFFAD